MTDAEGILLSDILPTGFEIGVQYGQVSPGDVVAVIGSGPVGLSAVMTARLYGPSKSSPSIWTTLVSPGPPTSVPPTRSTRVIRTGRSRSSPSPTERAWTSPSRRGGTRDVHHGDSDRPPGGNVANIGVHGTSVDLALNELWIKNIDISMGLVNTNTLGCC